MDAWRIWNVRAIDPGSGSVLDRATIAIEGGRITEVAEARGDAPEGAYDGRGRSLIPGAHRLPYASDLGHVPLARVRPAGRTQGRGSAAARARLPPPGALLPSVARERSDHDPGCRIERRRGHRHAAGCRARPDRRPADRLVRADRVGHLARRPHVRDDVQRGRRARGICVRPCVPNCAAGPTSSRSWRRARARSNARIPSPPS